MDKIQLPKEIDTHETAMHKCVEEVYFGTHSFTPSVTGRHHDAPVHASNDGPHKDLMPALNHRLAEPVLHYGADDRHDAAPFGAHTEHPNLAEGIFGDRSEAVKTFVQTIANLYMRLGLDSIGLPGQLLPLDYNGPLVPGASTQDFGASRESARQRAEHIDTIEKMESFSDRSFLAV